MDKVKGLKGIVENYQETLLKEEVTKEILAGNVYKYNNDDSIKSLYINREEYFIISDVYEFCNSISNTRVHWIADELRDSGLSVVLSKWELIQGGFNVDSRARMLTNKRGIITIISMLDNAIDKKIKFVEEEIINTNIEPEIPITEYVKYMVLPISVLNFDTHYQRKVSMEKVRQIAKKFDTRVVGALIVSKREDGYYLCDGQHRTKAMELVNVKTVMCAVHEGLTIEQEADLFWKCNTSRKAPSALDTFRAAIISGDKDSKRIYEICTEAGYRINLDRNEDNKTGFYMLTVSGLLSVYKTYGEDILDKALRILYKANIQKPSSMEIHGLSLFLDRYSDVGMDLGSLSEKLSKNSQTDLLARARMLTESIGGHTSTNYARVILGIYNNNKKVRIDDRLSNMK